MVNNYLIMKNTQNVMYQGNEIVRLAMICRVIVCPSCNTKLIPQNTNTLTWRNNNVTVPVCMICKKPLFTCSLCSLPGKKVWVRDIKNSSTRYSRLVSLVLFVSSWWTLFSYNEMVWITFWMSCKWLYLSL